jgi:multiple sugar transport system substrate-binding protein
MLESAGTEVLSGPTEAALEEGPAETALETMGNFGRSSVAAANVSTSTEDTARLGFETGGSTFMLNYPFVYPSAKENAPDVFENLAAAVYPRVVPDLPSRPPLGGINLGVSEFSEHPEETFEAVTCLVQPANQITAAQLGGLPPTREDVYASKEIKEAYPGFSELIKKSIEDAAPRPLTPAYTDLSLAIQRALHPVGKIDPADPTPAYEELRDKVEQAVKREGLL